MAGKQDSANQSSASELRRQLRKKRGDIPVYQRSGFDKLIRKHLHDLVIRHAAGSVAAFWPFDGEPDLIPLCRRLLANGLDIGLPVISKTGEHTMEFHPWQQESRLEQNRFGIPEPLSSTPRAMSDFDILAMPLVGYDLQGNRIGMGLGYYDRHLEALKNTRKPLRIGIAYGVQEVMTIPRNEWDVTLHGIINENGWFIFDD